ncbi:RWD domain-containing protein [Diaporthe amygdali]|uniref:RWD domain-containing protein n=1 Tax=Phomopsis amygdali TaxID=1214568 RepID=UPI0022FDE727|nr:RWD domain-containing protein [Diaporthe amygdali]KAJ0116912.1 RWD domain-containing protein [Diaporthe amygdali]
MDNEDQRDVELSSLSAIFPEIQRVHDDDPYTFVLDVPVNPTKAVTVFFPAATEAQGLNPEAAQEAGAAVVGANPTGLDSHELSHLPAVRVQISLPPAYPTEEPPAASVSTKPSWLPSATAKKLEDDCARLWEELGRDLVVFTYLDHVQQSADDVFGLVSDGALQISPEHKIAVLDYDIEAKRVAFDNGTFDCGVCLDPKKGAKCHRMIDCGHVFCTECLQNFYNNAIQEGDLAAVRCLEPSCAKERAAAQASSTEKRSKPRTFISPSELLQIPLEPDMVKRYVTLKYKTELESDKHTVYCPRPWCQGAARSKKRKKPEGFELHEAEDDSDSEAEEARKTEAEETAKSKPRPYVDRLAVCEDCGFAFCSRCYQGWHGDLVICAPRRDDGELSAEEKASLDFISLHTTPCPTCACPAQKTHGCNHMICYRCQTHFCYLCSAWLDPLNPYQHFNQQPNGRVTSCYMRLWELEEGDEDGQNFFAGGRGGAERAPRNEQEIAEIALEEAIVGDEGAHNQQQPEPRPVLNENGRRVDVEREGPLVLRIDAGAAAAPGARGGRQPAPAAQPRGGAQIRGRGNPMGGGRQQAAQQGRGGRGRGFGHRPNQNQVPNRGGGHFMRRDRHLDAQQQRDEAGHEEIQAGDAAWIRHFVQLALNDNEDLIDQDD